MAIGTVISVDAYKYTGVRVTYNKRNSSESMTLSSGTIFYYVTMSTPGDYVSLSPRGPFFKLSDSAFNKLSDKSEEYKMAVTTHKVLTPTDGSVRTFDSSMEYQLLLLKNKLTIYSKLTKKLLTAVPKGTPIKNVCTMSSAVTDGQIGVSATHRSVRYKLAFFVGANPYFSYSIWVPKSCEKTLDTLPVWSKRLIKLIPEVQMELFEPLGLKVNKVTRSKSIVFLPQKNFDGIIYQWSTKV